MRCASLLAVLLAGCQLAPPTPASDGGSLDGGARDFTGSASLAGPSAFTPRGALEGHNLSASGQPIGYSVFITDHGLSCAALEALDGGRVAVGFRQIYAGVIGQQPGNLPPAGSYQILASFPPGGGFAAFVAQSTLFDDGGSDGPDVATSGTLTLTSSGPDRLVGSFDVLLPTDGGPIVQLSGSFDAPYCP